MIVTRNITSIRQYSIKGPFHRLIKHMSRYKVEPIELSKISTYPLSSRPSKIGSSDFANPSAGGTPLKNFLDNMPNILAARDLRELASTIKNAKQKGRAIIVGIGGHVIKTGLAPILIDLMEHGYVSAIAMNGSAMIHDFEIALVGATSEDVDATLGSGSFGMAEETGRIINEAVNEGARDKIGMGEAIGRKLQTMDLSNAKQSLLYAAYAPAVPVTVHVALGTDIVHIHPCADGASIGQTSLQDFRLLCSLVRDLDDGGVYLNLGSAVVLPEVFLKTITVVRNLGFKLQDFYTANFDFIQQYRPLTNVVRRPIAGTGRGFSFIGHHEILIPLLAASILSS
jgi:arginine dihydrolase ArgZ-like protein